MCYSQHKIRDKVIKPKDFLLSILISIFYVFYIDICAYSVLWKVAYFVKLVVSGFLIKFSSDLKEPKQYSFHDQTDTNVSDKDVNLTCIRNDYPLEIWI